MTRHQVAAPAQWIEARKELLRQEKEFTRQRDKLSEARRNLPWLHVTKDYVFDGPAGRTTLAQLFGPHSQLIIYHFMFAPDWDNGCKSCSFWADSFNGILPHLAARDVAFAAISRAPFAKLHAFARRLGWSFPWYSSQDNDFNYDHQVSFTPEALAKGEAIYNYGPMKMQMSDMPGVSVFCKDDDGPLYHTYSSYGRGIDMLNAAYHYLDIAPKGRDEEGLPYSMAWVRHRDSYGS
jgi:predicted dithiol-disulfide oxidoreductase (DUF899 family)